MKNIFFYLFISFVFFCFSLGNSIVGTLSSAYAQQDWKQEYSKVCAKTQNAVTLSVEELKDYIARCDVLQDRIDDEDGLQGETERKVYAAGC